MTERINLVPPRRSVEIDLPDGRVPSGPRGARVGDFLSVLEFDSQVVAAVVNGDLRELTFPIKMDASLAPISMRDADGARVYRRSLTFLLETAFASLFPEAVLIIDHSISSGGYYCHVNGRKELNRNELQQLELEMKRLVDAAAADHTSLKQGVNERVFLHAYAPGTASASAFLLVSGPCSANHGGPK